MISLDQIKALRELTGVSIQACKSALTETKGDQNKAVELLRKKGEMKATGRMERSTGSGAIFSYIHTNKKIGILVELGCETDFVAKNEEFQTLGHDLALHIAGLNPLYLTPEEVPHELIEKEKEFWKAELKRENKPEKIWARILEGKEKKFREEISLVKQPFVKNPEVTIEKLVKEYIAKFGENIKIKRFVRFAI